jgi:citrate/tricarballylate utilization protein
MAAPERLEALIAEAQRVLAICNACRYCEGYCAVFPALERRLDFGENDIHYLANLCHNCGSCLYACQYAPPHEFAVSFPRLMAEVRVETYRKYTWPGFLRGAFTRNGLAMAAATGGSLAALFVFLDAYAGMDQLDRAWSDAQGAFYALVPHGVMTAIFGVAFVAALAMLGIGVARFWRDTGERVGDFFAPHAAGPAAVDALVLRYLDGGGIGCTYPRARPSLLRRRFHHLTFYGFMLCFAATCVATVYHYGFGWKAPYPLASLPVILGTLGGIGLVIGPVGLLWLHGRRDPELGDPAQNGMDAMFIWMLFLTGVTGLLLLAFRETRAMGTLLAVHLGLVLALFLTMPYGKFVHGLYRLAALARFHLERRRPLPDIASE